MPKTLLLICILLFGLYAFGQDERSVCIQINDLNTAVLLGKADKHKAVKKLNQLVTQLRGNKPALTTYNWTFPLKDYKSNAIGGTNGNGYSDKGYHYLDGNKHAAHPAHDIFINDKNQDCVDDKTHKPVDVLVVYDGIVVACSSEWQPSSDLRGGKYIWVYHPGLNIFTYYAHNNNIFVKPGDELSAGQKIAEVGRTGYNAYKKRSPTHLHFSAFRLVNGLPVPFNPYVQLKKARTI